MLFRSLADLLALYSQGLRQPLAVFPDTCWAYAEAAWGKKPKASPLQIARDTWEGGTFAGGVPGESQDEWVRLCFRDCPDPLDGTWEELTRRIFEPMMNASAEAELKEEA